MEPTENPIEPQAPAPQNPEEQNVAAPAEPAPAPQPEQPSQPLPTQAAVPQAPLPQAPLQTKILPSKYLPGIVLISIVSGALFNVLLIVWLVLWLVFIVVVWAIVSKIKATSDGQISDEERTRTTYLMAIEPMSSQAIYYYRMKKSHPVKAKFYNSLGWRVFLIELFIAFVVGIILSVAVVHKLNNSLNSTTASNNANTSSGQYVNKQYGFSFTPPSGWVQVSAQGLLVHYQTSSPDSDGHYPGVNIQRTSAQSLTLKQAVSGIISINDQQVPSYTVISQTSETFLDAPAVMIKYSGSIQSIPLEGYDLLLEHGGYIYSITGDTDSADWSTYGNVLKNSVLSFKFD